MLHRFRTAMVRPGRERLRGTVELDETFLGGPEPGRPGRGALGKTMVEVAVERDGTRLGRCRLAVIDDAGAASLHPFLLAHVEPGSVVLSDGWAAYPAACGADYRHEALVISGSGSAAHELLPAPTGSPRWRSAGSWAPPGRREAGPPAGLPRRIHVPLQPPALAGAGMLFHRLLEGAVGASPRTYRSLVVGPGSGRRTMPMPPSDKRVRSESLAGERRDRPWRTAAELGTLETQ